MSPDPSGILLGARARLKIRRLEPVIVLSESSDGSCWDRSDAVEALRKIRDCLHFEHDDPRIRIRKAIALIEEALRS